MCCGRITPWLFALAIIGWGMSMQPKQADPEKSLIDRMHAYYQSQFDNLELLKQGIFGAARVERSAIKAHGREGGDPGFNPPGYVTMVTIYGNHGARLDPKTISDRYRRQPGSEKEPIAEWPDTQKLNALVSRAAALAAKGNKGPFSTTTNGWRIEIRPIVLSKPECLKCHKPLKKDDAVALAMYSVHRNGPASSR